MSQEKQSQKQDRPQMIEEGDMLRFFRSAGSELNNYIEQTHNKVKLKKDDFNYIQQILEDSDSDFGKIKQHLRQGLHFQGALQAKLNFIKNLVPLYKCDIDKGTQPQYFLSNVIQILEYESQNQGTLPWIFQICITKFEDLEKFSQILINLAQSQNVITKGLVAKLEIQYQKFFSEVLGVILSSIGQNQTIDRKVLQLILEKQQDKLQLPITINTALKYGLSVNRQQILLVYAFIKGLDSINLQKVFQQSQQLHQSNEKGSNKHWSRSFITEIDVLTQDQIRLTKEDMIYLAKVYEDLGLNSYYRELKAKILVKFRDTANKGYNLPEQTINLLKKILFSQDKKLAFIAAYIIGKQAIDYPQIHPSVLPDLNKYLKIQRKNAIQAISMIIKSNEIQKDFLIDITNNLKQISQNSSLDQELRKAAITALSDIADKIDVTNLEDLVKNLLVKENNEQIVRIFLTQSIKQVKMSLQAIQNLSHIIVNDFPEESRINSSLALSYISEYQKKKSEFSTQKTYQNIFKAINFSSNTDITNNILAVIANLIKTDQALLMNEDLIQSLVQKLYEIDTQLNASYIFEQFAESLNINNPQQVLTFQKVIQFLVKIISNDQNQIESRQNLIKAIAHASKIGVNIGQQHFNVLIDLIPQIQEKSIRHGIITALLFSKNRQDNFNKENLSILCKFLDDDDEIVRGGFYFILKNCQNICLNTFQEQHFQILTDNLQKINAQQFSSALLKKASFKNVSFRKRITHQIAEQIIEQQIDDESLLYLSKAIFKQSQLKGLKLNTFMILTQENKFNDQILEYILDALNYTFKNYKGIQPEQNFIENLTQLLSNQKSTDGLKQKLLTFIGKVSENQHKPNIKLLQLLIEHISFNQDEIKKQASFALKNYIREYPQFIKEFNNQEIIKLQSALNNVITIDNLVFVVQSISKYWNLNPETVQILERIIIDYGSEVRGIEQQQKSKEVRDCAKNIILQLKDDSNRHEKIKKMIFITNQCDGINLAVAKNLLELCKNDQLIPIDCLYAIQNMIDFYLNNLNSDYKYFEDQTFIVISEALQIIANMQKIPSELLENIVKLILSNQIKNPIFYRNLIKCISLAIKFGNNTPAKLYEDIESYFQKVTDIEQRYDLLSIIDSAVLRQNILQKKTLEILESYIQNFKDSETYYLLLQILRKVKMNGQELTTSQKLVAINEEIQDSEEDQQIYNKKGEEKNILMLIKELRKMNQNQGYQNIDQIKIMEQIKEINIQYQSKFKNYKEYQITEWVEQFKLITPENRTKSFNRCMAAIKRGIYLYTGYELRNIQIIAILQILNKTEDKGIIAQVSTGEGKSTIICVLAIIKALNGTKVDIITSSEILAKRDVEEKQNLYKMFGLRAMSNSDEGYKFYGPKQCYVSADIIYGDISNFQFDLLRDEFSNLGTRSQRKFEYAIFDEVDNIFIDECQKIAMTGSVIPAMDYLTPVLLSIWYQVNKTLQHLHFIDGVYYFIEDLNYQIKDGEIQCSDENEQVLQIYDPYLFIHQDIEFYIQEVVLKNFKIPNHLHDYTKIQRKKWIDNALAASNQFQLGRDYIMVNDNHGVTHITPVDYQNTGLVQNGTVLGDGLHQFLQIKHNLKVTSENLTTNFISNFGFIERYIQKDQKSDKCLKNNIVGLTGTIGSENCQKIFKDIYNMSLIVIPRYKSVRFEEKQGIICDNQQDWKNKIVDRCIEEGQKRRAILIICETISDANSIKDELFKYYQSGLIKSYTRSDNQENQAASQIVNSGDIIVATNLAGRGTDLKTTPEIEKNGGLHVIVTFLPINQRVELQAFGRTARQGLQGTAQLILNSKILKDNQSQDIIKIKQQRDDQEGKQLRDQFMSSDFKFQQQKDRLFRELCQFINEIRNKEQQLSGDSASEIQSKYKIIAIEERWGIWLKNLNSKSNIQKEFEIFKDELQSDYQNNKLIKNFSYFIQEGNEMTKCAKSKWFFQKSYYLYEEAYKSYQKAIDLDQNFAYNAYYNRAYIQCQLSQSNFEYKDKIIMDLKQTQAVISDIILPQLQAMHILKQSADINQDFTEQVMNKINILMFQLKSISQTIESIKNSKKLIDIHSKTNTQTGLNFKDASNYIYKAESSHLNDLTFHNLIAYRDIRLKNTLKDAVEIIPKGHKISIQYEYLSQQKALDLLPITQVIQEKIQKPNIDDQIDKQNAEKEQKQGFISQGIKITKDIFNKQVQNVNILANEFTYSDAIAINLNITLNNIDSLLSRSFLLDQKLRGYKFMINIDVRGLKFDEIIPKSQNLSGKEIEQFECFKYLTFFEKNYLKKMNENRKQFIEEQKNQINSDQKYEEELMQYVKITLKIYQITQKQAQQIILQNECQYNIEFADLDKKNGLIISDALATINSDNAEEAQLKMHSLSRLQSIEIMKKMKSIRNEQALNAQIKSIDDLFLSSNYPVLELLDFSNNGLHGIIDIYGQKPIQWASVITVAILGVLQIIGGACLAVFSLGAASIQGFSIILGGLNDIYTAVSGAISRNFSMKDYLIQKSIDLALMVATGGFAFLKEGARMAKVGAQQSYKFVIRKVASKAAQEGSKQIVKDGFKLAAKAVVIETAEFFAKKGLNSACNLLSDIALQDIKRSLQQQTDAQIQSIVNAEHNNRIINQAYAIDRANQNQEQQNIIETSAQNIISPNNGKLYDAIYQLGTGLVKQASTIGNLGVIFAEGGMAAQRINTIAKDFKQAFNKSLESIEKRFPTVQKLISKELKLSQNEQKFLQEIIIRNKILDQKNPHKFNEKWKFTQQKQDQARSYLSLMSNQQGTIYDINFKQLESKKNQIIQAMITIDDAQKEDYNINKNFLAKTISNQIVENIMSQINGGFIQPVQGFIIDKTVNKISKRIQRKVAGVKNQKFKLDKYGNKIQDKDGNFKLEGKTIKEQIEDYISLRNVEHAVNQQANNENISDHGKAQHVKNLHPLQQLEFEIMFLEDLSNSQEGSLALLGIAAKKLQRPIKVMKNGQVYTIIGDKLSGKPFELEYVPPGSKGEANSQGHWQRVDGRVIEQSGKNNCFFDAIGIELNMKGNDFRKFCSDELGHPSNRQFFKHIIPHFKHMQDNNPNFRDQMMFGGVKIKGDFYKNANLEGKYPSGKRITITVGESEDIKEIIEDLRNQLNKVWFQDRPEVDKDDKYPGKYLRKQEQITGIIRKYDNKNGFMLGVLKVQRNDDTVEFLVGFSGDADMVIGHKDNIPKKFYPKFQSKNIIFVNYDFNIKQELIDIEGKKQNINAEKACAAMKMFQYLGNQQAKNFQDERKGIKKLEMFEVWHQQPGTKQKSYDWSQEQPCKSCDNCQKILPKLT